MLITFKNELDAAAWQKAISSHKIHAMDSILGMREGEVGKWCQFGAEALPPTTVNTKPQILMFTLYPKHEALTLICSQISFLEP